MKKFIPYLFVFSIVVSCYRYKEPDKPKDLISKANMVKILIDLKLLTTINGPDAQVLDSNRVDVRTFIYQKYQIDSAQFASSNSYYAFYVDDYEEIYNRVKDSLEALSKLYKAQEEQELKDKKTQDSLRLIKEKDSLKLGIKDSLGLDIKKDSLKDIRAEIRRKKSLIKPISDTDAQPQ